MRIVNIGPNIIVRYPASIEICRKHDTSPEIMKNLFLEYKSCFIPLIDFFGLNKIKFTFNIDNWRGAGIDTDFRLDLTWVEQPRGFVTIYLGFPDECNSIVQNEIKHTLSHEFVHVLIFSYLTSYMNCAPQWINKGYYLPDECKVPKVYIELLCDTLGLTSQYENAEFFLEKWQKEWNPKSPSYSGAYYFDENHNWAIEFIKKESMFVHDILRKHKSTSQTAYIWKTIFDHYLKSEKAKEWMSKATKILRTFKKNSRN